MENALYVPVVESKLKFTGVCLRCNEENLISSRRLWCARCMDSDKLRKNRTIVAQRKMKAVIHYLQTIEKTMERIDGGEVN